MVSPRAWRGAARTGMGNDVARSYLCPHCGAKNRYRPEDANDGVVACSSCREAFVLPDADGGRSHAETAVIDARGVRPTPPAPEKARPAANHRAPTVLVSSERPQAPPSRARTILISDPPRPSRSEPRTPSAPPAPTDLNATVPAFMMSPPRPAGPRWIWAVAAAVLAGGGAWLASWSASPSRDTSAAVARSEAVAEGVATAMRAGRPDLARLFLSATHATVVTPDGVPAFARGHATYRQARPKACKADTAVTRAWLASGDPIIAELGASPCETDWPLEDSALPTAIPELAGKLTGSVQSWEDKGSEVAVAPIHGEPICATCHGDSARSGTMAYAIVTLPAPARPSGTWLWPATTALLVLALLTFVGRRRAAAEDSFV